MAKGDSPTRGRELNIHFGDLVRGYVGQISHLGDMVPVMAGVTLSFKMRGEPRVGLVYVGDGATSTGAFHEGINFAAVQRCPLVVDRREQRVRILDPDRQADRGRIVCRQSSGLRRRRRTRRRQRCPRHVRRHQAGRRSGARRRWRHAGRALHVPAQRPCGARQPIVCAGGRDRALGTRQ